MYQNFSASRRVNKRVFLRLLATTDLHGHVFAHDYVRGVEDRNIGLESIWGLVNAFRADGANTLLVDNGDTWQGSALTDTPQSGDAPHPMTEAMNAVGYDAGTLGNHDFNFGLDYVSAVTRDAAFPVVVSNVRPINGPKELSGTPWVTPHAILEKTVTCEDGTDTTLKIGILGFAPENIVRWDKDNLEGHVVAEPILEAATKRVPDLRAAGADIVVALCHSGMGSADHPIPDDATALALSKLPGIDVVVAGHSHYVDAINNQDFAPIVQPGSHGRYLGIIDLYLSQIGTTWHRVGQSAYVRPVSGDGPKNPCEFPSLVRKAHDAICANLNAPIGMTQSRLHTLFAMCAPSNAVRLVAEAKRDWVEAARVDTQYEALPLLTVVAPTRCGGHAGPDHFTDTPAGVLVERNRFQIYAYPSKLCTTVVTGAVLKSWLERAASVFNQQKIGCTGRPLVNPDFPSYNFDTVHGLTYQIDLSQPAQFNFRGVRTAPESNRIVSLSYGGQPVDHDQKFLVATNNFRMSSNKGFPQLEPAISFDVSIWDVMRKYLASHNFAQPQGPPTWSFCAMENTTCRVQSASWATQADADAVGLPLTACGHDAQGFSLFDLRL